MSDTVRIYEVSPRDGLQNEAAVVPTAGKAELVAHLCAAGLPDVEVTSFVRAHWIPQLADAQELVRLLPADTNTRFWGLVPNRVGLERAIESGIGGVATFLSASETHNKKNVNRTVRESLAGVEEVLATAKADGLRTRGYISTVFGCPYEGEVAASATLAIALRLRAAGAEQIVLSDTTGMGSPMQVERIIQTVLDGGIPLAELAVHFHDTRGTALVNAMAAWKSGITTFDASVAGIGGCPYAPGAAGNLATEDLVYLFDQIGVTTGVDLEALAEAGHFAAELLGRELPGRYHQYHRGARVRAAARAAR